MTYKDDVINRTELLPGETYFVQCMAHGLVGVARPGSALEEMCRKRDAAGFLDAPCLCAEDCPKCRAERAADDAFWDDMDFDMALAKECRETREMGDLYFEEQARNAFDRMMEENEDATEFAASLGTLDVLDWRAAHAGNPEAIAKLKALHGFTDGKVSRLALAVDQYWGEPKSKS